QLADLGARVIKVERPDVGDFARGYDQRVKGLSSHFVWVNRNKESLALDAKDPRGRALLHRLVAGADGFVQNLAPAARARRPRGRALPPRLVAGADVFVQTLAPGAAGRLGLAAAALRAEHPRLVVC